MHTRIVEAPFASGHAHAVIGEKEDDGIVGKAVGGKLIEYSSDLAVHEDDAIAVSSPGPARRRGVGIEWRQ
jgi:hypothetical protein